MPGLPNFFNNPLGSSQGRSFFRTRPTSSSEWKSQQGGGLVLKKCQVDPHGLHLENPANYRTPQWVSGINGKVRPSESPKSTSK